MPQILVICKSKYGIIIFRLSEMMQGIEMENGMLPLNTHKIVTKLTDTGIKQKQSEAIVDAISDIVVKAVSNLATKAELNAVKTELKAEIKDSEHRVMMEIQKLAAEIQKISADMHKSISGMHKSISGMKTWLIGFMLTMFIGVFSMMGAMLKIMLDISHLVK